MKLTVAIPTYNRNQILLENIRALLPQLSADCKLLIIDNCSDVPVSETLGELLSDYAHLDIEIRRNRVNVGGSANVMRCFEYCETEWVWVLGDDDRVRPDAVRTITKSVAAHPQSLFINFASEIEQRKASFTTEGIDDFVARMDSFSNVLLISTSIYKARELAPHIKLGYLYAYTLAPQFVTLLSAIGEKGVCSFSHEAIINWSEAPASQQWSAMNFALGLPLVLDLPLKSATRRALAEKLLWIRGKEIVSLNTIARQLISRSKSENDTESALYLYDQVLRRRAYYDRSISLRVRAFVHRKLLRFPSIGRRVIPLLYRIVRRRKNETESFSDRFERS